MRRASVVRAAMVGAIVVAAIAAIRLLPLAQWLAEFQSYVKGLGAAGYIVYTVVYALCVALFIPASLLTIGAGALFGFTAGTIVVVIGATIGATLAFLLARTLMRRKVEAMTAGNPKFAALDRAIAREGTKIVLLVRLAVVFPFTYVNYAFGLTGIRLLPYVIATFFGILPATAAFVFASSAAANAATQQTTTVMRTVYVFGAVAAIAASVFVGRLATRAIRRAGVDENGAADSSPLAG